ncbi:ATP-grasp domain-containing protein [Solibacillus daqui]|uniref:ATP-grasp domain-containing protein n=1 Tax=Solibacillus daqui TaxID=2912187 RepID=UPI0023670AB7|nr:ATP-grasp domain-containing protein [Solibacillus daqui]
MYNILVTGVGAIIGYGIVHSLRQSQYNVTIIGTDIYEDAVGKEWCDFFEQGKIASSLDYPQFLTDLIVKYDIDLVIPGIEQDIDRITKEYEYFTKLNVKFAINDMQLIDIANDKWLTHLALIKNKLNVIPTFIEGSYIEIEKKLGIPMLLKPRKSYASKGIYKIQNIEDYNYWKFKLCNEFMVQKIVGDIDSEYTVAAFGLGDGTSSQKISLKRKLGPDGATAKAKVVDIVQLNNTVDKLVSIFKPVGPTNFQFRYHEGEFLLLEINPRISSSTSIRNSFGYNEAEMCIDFYLKNKTPKIYEIKNGSAIRYVKEKIYYDSDNI